jgi:membrane protease YdiL (CAAX protease family)
VAGLASGAILYAGTRVFVALVGPRWPAFVRHARAIYAQDEGRLGALTVAAAGAVAVGEELFWRGLAQRELAARLDAAVIAAAATLGLYVLANAASRNLAILSGAVVGGAVWVALAWWTGGVLASIASHATWTALMLLRPAVGGAR